MGGRQTSGGRRGAGAASSDGGSGPGAGNSSSGTGARPSSTGGTGEGGTVGSGASGGAGGLATDGGSAGTRPGDGGAGGTGIGCPPGTFSPEGDDSECTPWSTCGIGLWAVAPGSAMTDVVCGPTDTFPAVSLGGQGNAGAMVATDEAVYMAVRATIDGAPGVLRMSIDGDTQDVWLVDMPNGGALRSLATLGSHVAAGGISFGAGFSPADFSAVVVRLNDSGGEDWHLEFRSDDAWVGPAFVASADDFLFVARAHVPLTCQVEGGIETCLPLDEGELVLSAYDETGELIWDGYYGGFGGALEIQDFTASAGQLFVATSSELGVLQFDDDGNPIASHASAELGGGLPLSLSPGSNGAFVLSHETNGNLEHLAFVDDMADVSVIGNIPGEGSDYFNDLLATDAELRVTGKEASTAGVLFVRMEHQGAPLDRVVVSRNHASNPASLAVTPDGRVFVGGTTRFYSETFGFIVPWPE